MAVADLGEVPGWAPPHLIFRPNWGPKSRKKFFWRPPPALSQGLDDQAPLISGSGWLGPPLSQGLDDRASLYLRVWMTGPPLISGSGWPGPPLSQGLDDWAPPYLRVWMTGPPLISGSGWPGPPLIWRSGSATVWGTLVEQMPFTSSIIPK